MIKNMPRREFLSKTAIGAAALQGVMSPLAVTSADKTAPAAADTKGGGDGAGISQGPAVHP